LIAWIVIGVVTEFVLLLFVLGVCRDAAMREAEEPKHPPPVLGGRAQLSIYSHGAEAAARSHSLP
jgi:hypothetical protein